MKNNKGFSLVELIIVIAIMAILVGVMAPQLIKFIEKTNVSSDVQLCDDIHTAIYTAMLDPDVVNAGDGSSTLIEDFAQPGTDFALTSLAGSSTNNAFGDAVRETLGFDPFNSSCRDYLKSSPAKSSGVISIYINSSGSGFYVFIDNSDNSGQKQTYSGVSNLDKMICSPTFVN